MRRDDWLIHQLPVAMTENDFFVRFVTIFQRTAESIYSQIDGLEHQFDASVASPEMVRTLGSWLGVRIDSSLDDRTQREIVRRYAELIRWRGTRRGLVGLLELITEGPVSVTDNGGVFAEGEAPGGPPTVRIDVESTGIVTMSDLIRYVRDELPATVSFRLLVAGDEIWPSPDAIAANQEMEARHG